MYLVVVALFLWPAARAGAEGVTPPADEPLVGNWAPDRVELRPLSLRAVNLRGFLGAHVDANNRQSLTAGLESLIPAGIEARSRGQEPPQGCRRLATDSDFYKWLEGACYAVVYDPSLTGLAGRIDKYAQMLTGLQDESGYLGTGISPAEPFDVDVAHDLYVAGHFIEAAVAHYEVAGNRLLLDAAVRLADFYLQAWRNGHEYYEIVGTKEHPEIELALVRLYRATGKTRFLEFSQAVARKSKVGPGVADLHAGGGARHAVRTCYLLCGIAEHFMETGDTHYYRHLPGLWNEIVSTRMYVTGGIGYNERIALDPFDLPQYLSDNPHRDIAETCASVSLMMFSWRMHAITGKSRHFDTIETILYNHYLGAISEDHLANFYYNPLRRLGDLSGRTDHGASPVERLRLPQIHSTACCLPNSWRFFAQLPEYVFSCRDDAILINLYTDATARHRLPDGTPVTIVMETGYPRTGKVHVRVGPDRPTHLAIGLRIPAWCEGATLYVAGARTDDAAGGGYHLVNRVWSAGDEIVLDLPMPPRVLRSRPEVAASRGQVVFGRGPLIYCLEKQDAAGLDLEQAAVVLAPDDPPGSARTEFDRAIGLHVLKVRAGIRDASEKDQRLSYPLGRPAVRNVREVTLIPFYYRANRSPDSRWITFIPFEWGFAAKCSN